VANKGEKRCQTQIQHQAALTPQLSPQVTAALQQHIPILLAGVARKINIAQVLAAAGQIADIEVDKIVVGSARIGQLTLNGTSLNLRSGSAYLRNVRIVVELPRLALCCFPFA
jgi:hypothetical protein